MDQITQTLTDSVSGVVAMNGISGTYYPPTFDTTDPVPMINRGYRFSGGQFMQLPPYFGSSSPNIFLGVTMTIEFWVKPESVAAINPLFSKGQSVTYTKCSEILTIEINTDKKLQISGGFPNVQIVATNSDFSTLWTYISIVFNFSGGSTQVSFYINGVQVGSTQTLSFWIRDNSSASSTLLGASYTRTSFYQGFMWRFRIFNFARTGAQIAADITGSNPTGGITLSSCSTTTFPSGCAACLGTCNYGCVRAQDCVLCIDPLCLACTDFTVNTCSQCKPHASFTAGTGCSCASNLYYYDSVSFTCLHCNTLCYTCSSSTSCSACYINSNSPTNGMCTCNAGFYYNSSSDQCLACDLTCATCSLGSKTSCLTCKANAALSQAAPAACVCSNTYYMNTSTGNCVACSLDCRTCSAGTSNDCQTCYLNADLLSTAPSSCVCVNGFYPNTHPYNCAACSSECETCNAGTSSDCLTCYLNAVLSSAAPSSCVCAAGFYFNLVAQSCELCDSSCMTCAGGTMNDCTSCASYATLSHAAPAPCVCLDGFYNDPSSGACVLCDIECNTCNAGTNSDCLTCYPNAVLFQTPPSSCICAHGYYTSSTVNSCGECNPECGTCSGGSSSECESCNSHAVLSAIAPASCVCVDGYYLEMSTIYCVACDTTCKTCLGGGTSDCQSCLSGSHLLGTAPTSCSCALGFWFNPISALCETCDATCKTCSDGTAMGCTQCVDNAKLSATYPSICSCLPGYFWSDGNLRSCLACDSTCVQCRGQGPEKCTSCYPFAQLQSKLTSSLCLCSANYFPSPNSASCLPCHPTCLTCATNAITACHSCQAQAHLAARDPGACQCDAGHFPNPDASQCAPCSDGCISCSDPKNCMECASGYGLKVSACATCPSNCSKCTDSVICQKCIAGFFLTYLGECKDCSDCDSPLSASAAGPFGNTYNITFSRIVVTRLTDTDVKLTSNPASALTWRLSQTDILRIEVFEGPWENGSSILITFVAQVVDEFGYYLSNTELTVPAPLADGKVSNPLHLNDSTSMSQTVTIGSSTIVGSAMVLGAAAGCGGLAMALLSQMQYFSYIGSINYTVTQTTTSFYTSLDQQSSLPNFFKYTDRIARRLALDQAASSTDFFNSAGQLFSVLLVLMGVHTILYLLNRVFGRRWKLLGEVKVQFEWKVYLYFWYCAYLDLTVTALVEVKTANVDTNRGIISLVFAALTLALTVATPFLVFFLIYFKQNQLSTEELNPWKLRFSAVVAVLRTDVSWAKYLHVVYYFQRLLYACLIVFVRSHREYSAGFLILPCLLMTVFVLITRPMLSKTMRILHLIAEIDSLLVFALLFASTLRLNTPDINICWVSVVLTLKSFSCTVLMTIVGVSRGVKKFCARRRWKVQPTLNSESIIAVVNVKGEETEMSFGPAFNRVEGRQMAEDCNSKYLFEMREAGAETNGQEEESH